MRPGRVVHQYCWGRFPQGKRLCEENLRKRCRKRSAFAADARLPLANPQVPLRHTTALCFAVHDDCCRRSGSTHFLSSCSLLSVSTACTARPDPSFAAPPSLESCNCAWQSIHTCAALVILAECQRHGCACAAPGLAFEQLIQLTSPCHFVHVANCADVKISNGSAVRQMRRASSARLVLLSTVLWSSVSMKKPPLSVACTRRRRAQCAATVRQLAAMTAITMT
jgi:hypothetical protein